MNMFENYNPRYMSKAIAEKIHPEIQILLWHLIDLQKQQEEELDYLQVFELRIHGDKQSILHRQEIPFREKQWLIPLEESEAISTTIWCIDNDEGQIMLYPEDY